MTSIEIKEQVQDVIDNFDQDDFIYDLLRAYGISKAGITRLQKGDYNLSKVNGEILYKKKLLFRETSDDELMAFLEDLCQPENLKHNPRFVIVTNYKKLVAQDTKNLKSLHINLNELPKNYGFFLPWAGHENYETPNESEADRKAAYRMAKLYDILVQENPDFMKGKTHQLNLFFTRLLFCFFAEDTDIFPEEGMFTSILMKFTQDDGSDVHLFLKQLFDLLNEPEEKRQNTPEHLKNFPYVNGGLFKDTIEVPKFNKKARKIIKESGSLVWREINPDIFGSMIQAVVHPGERENLGMHYTSVPNILKVIKPLFLDELYEELEQARGNSKKLRRLIKRISVLKIFDPACGSGNFLIIAYKELRKLEVETWQEILATEPQQSLIYPEIQLTQFYGIEIDDFAHEIAKLSLWLAEHQMNRYFKNHLTKGRSRPLLPLKASGKIECANATHIDWEEVCPKEKGDEIYLLGNPPYLGARYQKTIHRKDMTQVLNHIKGYKRLDYICIWFYKAKKFIEGINSKSAFVSTNSICQGEQAITFWPKILGDKKFEIEFAYQSFKWNNNAKGKAGVTVIIVGLRNKENSKKNLYVNETKKEVSNINAYLVEGENVFVQKRRKPLSDFPKIGSGNRALDDGNLLLNENEKNELVNNYPEAQEFIKPVVGALEFLRGIDKYCLWISDEQLKSVDNIPPISERIGKVQEYRLNRNNTASKDPAEFPHQFLKRKMAKESVLFLPTVSSERRNYIPIGFYGKETVIIDPNFAIYDPEPFIFGILSSKMHMAWVKTISGKLKTDYRYSSTLCYNTFPFPNISKVKKANIEEHVFSVLEEREKRSEKTMAELYDPEKMPAGLRQAHKGLDKAVERCYRTRPFDNDTQRLEYLFKEYEKMVGEKKTGKKGKERNQEKV